MIVVFIIVIDDIDDDDLCEVNVLIFYMIYSYWSVLCVMMILIYYIPRCSRYLLYSLDDDVIQYSPFLFSILMTDGTVLLHWYFYSTLIVIHFSVLIRYWKYILMMMMMCCIRWCDHCGIFVPLWYFWCHYCDCIDILLWLSVLSLSLMWCYLVISLW